MRIIQNETNNCDGCHLGLQSYEMTQVNFHIFQKTAEVVHEYDYISNQKHHPSVIIFEMLQNWKSSLSVTFIRLYKYLPMFSKWLPLWCINFNG